MDKLNYDNYIYDNEIITFEELKNYAEDRIIKCNLSDFCASIIEDSDCDNLMEYMFFYRTILTNYRKTTIAAKNQFSSIYPVILPWQNKKVRKYYEDNFINIYFLHNINHELEHVNQNKQRTLYPDENMSKLIDICIKLINNNLLCMKKYKKHHHKYLIEYLATVNAGYIMLNEVLKRYCYVIREESIYLYNCYLANYILEGYPRNSYNKDISISPIKLLFGLSSSLKDAGEKYILSRPLSKIKQLVALEELCNQIRINEIKELTFSLSEDKENNINDLLLGKELSNEVLNNLHDIALGKTKTRNLYEKIN
jgi:hypothetical protein